MSNIEFTTSNDPSSLTPSRTSPSDNHHTTITHSFRTFITPQTSLEEIHKVSHWFDQDRIDYHTLRFHDAIQRQILNRSASEKDKKTAQSLLDIIRLKYIFPYSRLLGLFTYFYILTIKNLFRGN
ncbi:hypothetical protein FDP41_001751 [Naegleria fowleri]|uniref:Uncharacterized protein n=1 Tax=Naegleria fowleri TaxID=5763 RepID=A0A6A5C0I0_NAEFO|nr:uncharacterized protein FDP41_001751 [Naegleria fowleri]KAF0979408.1 hypothetical protein FDP41_001751 [Naegleria fowleri]